MWRNGMQTEMDRNQEEERGRRRGEWSFTQRNPCMLAVPISHVGKWQKLFILSKMWKPYSKQVHVKQYIAPVYARQQDLMMLLLQMMVPVFGAGYVDVLSLSIGNLDPLLRILVILISDILLL